MSAEAKKKQGMSRFALVICNVVLMLGALIFAVVYSTQVRQSRVEMELDTFETTIESMKQVSGNYINAERRYAEDWAAYMEAQDMTVDEALAYVRESNTQEDRYAHIVDMDTFEARSSRLRKDGSDSVSVYQELKEQNWELFRTIMNEIYDGQPSVLGRYRVRESQIMVISVGTRVTLREADGTHRDYLLLRVIPVESMKKIWIFPLEYADAEIGLITQHGDYVLPSASMRSENFIEFIRAYNYADDYNGANVLLTQLAENESGMWEYKNAKGQMCYWYYSRLKDGIGMDIVGCIPKDTLTDQRTDWSIVAVVVTVLVLLVLMDGAHIMGINRRLRETAKLAEQASEAKTRFLSSMSHDIRTPLNAVLGMTELARKRPDDTAYVQECLEKISVSGSHLLTLINDVLEISRVESGRTVLNPEPFWLDDLVTGMEDIIRAQAQTKGVEFELQLHSITKPRLVGDRLRLSQIYLNLLTNAVKYTETGGHVRLDISEKEIPGGMVELQCIVADDGMGMSEEFQKTMYESFSRATDSRIDKIQGTGLGLAIVKSMLDMMDGSIRCDSAPGKGTVFTTCVTLAAAPAEVAEHTVLRQADCSGSLEGVRLLIAEDNDLNWEIINAMLSDKGILCTRAENGRVCVDLLENSPPGTFDMVLMDIQMPLLNGRDAARLLRQSSRADLRTIPIAAMTADAFAEDVQNCLDAGMNAHLSKPVDLEKVLATIWQFCRNEKEPQ